MIDEAVTGTIFYRLVISPDPLKEDGLKDLDLRELTVRTIMHLEERTGTRIPTMTTRPTGMSMSWRL
jgi:hypothetical protein